MVRDLITNLSNPSQAIFFHLMLSRYSRLTRSLLRIEFSTHLTLFFSLLCLFHFQYCSFSKLLLCRLISDFLLFFSGDLKNFLLARRQFANQDCKEVVSLFSTESDSGQIAEKLEKCEKTSAEFVEISVRPFALYFGNC